MSARQMSARWLAATRDSTLLGPIYAEEAFLQANLVPATSDDRPSIVSCYRAELLDGLALVITTVVGDQACPLDEIDIYPADGDTRAIVLMCGCRARAPRSALRPAT